MLEGCKIVEEQNSTSNYFVAVFFLCLSCCCYSANSMFAKAIYIVDPTLSGYDIMLSRGLFGLLFVSAQSWYFKLNVFEFKNIRGLCLVTSFIGMFSTLTSLLSLRYIPATKSSLIGNSYPVLGIIFAAVILKETISRIDVYAIGVMVLGLIVLVSNKRGDGESQNQELGYILALSTSIIFSVVSTGLSIMNKNVNILIYPFFYSLFALVSILVISSFYDDFIHIRGYTFTTVILLAFYGIGSILAQTFMSMAYKYGDSGQLSPLWNITMVFNFAIESTVLGHQFSITDYLGASILLCSFLIPVMSRMFYK